MPLDLGLFSSKLRKSCELFAVTVKDLASATGIPPARLGSLLSGEIEPSGDEVLILADYFREDYRYFVSNERDQLIERTDALFRKHGDALSAADRWAIQEFLFLCGCEHFLLSELSRIPTKRFKYRRQSTFYKGEGERAALEFRRFVDLSPAQPVGDVFQVLRRAGIRVFRRRLENSGVSGLFIRHPEAGDCVLVNYSEDVYRQRFTVSHEAAHAILDDREVFSVSAQWSAPDLSEIGANAFASHFLLPKELLAAITLPGEWTPEKTKKWCNIAGVNPDTLAIAIEREFGIASDVTSVMRRQRIPRAEKQDAELSGGLSERGLGRKRAALEKGLSSFYVSLCFDAYENGIVSAGRVAEMLLTDAVGLTELAQLYGRQLQYDG